MMKINQNTLVNLHSRLGSFIVALLLVVLGGVLSETVRAESTPPQIQVRFWQDDSLYALKPDEQNEIVTQICAHVREKWRFLDWCVQDASVLSPGVMAVEGNTDESQTDIVAVSSEENSVAPDANAPKQQAVWWVKVESKPRPPEEGPQVREKVVLSHYLNLNDGNIDREVKLGDDLDLYGYFSEKPVLESAGRNLILLLKTSIKQQFGTQEEWPAANSELMRIPLADQLVYHEEEEYSVMVIPVSFCFLKESERTRFRVVMRPRGGPPIDNKLYFVAGGAYKEGRIAYVDEETSWMILEPTIKRTYKTNPIWVEGLKDFQEQKTSAVKVYLEEYHPDYTVSCNSDL
jgi:hypothetical protein